MEKKRTIAITSGKGGVGKTSIVSNIAYFLSYNSKSIYILDADFSLGNVDVMFGIIPRFNIKDYLDGTKRIQDIMVKGPNGIRIIPATTGVSEFSNLSEEERDKIFLSFKEMDGYDYLIVDTAAGISSNVVYFNHISDESFIIITPEPASLTDSYATIKVLRNKTGRKEFHVIMNMVRDEREAITVFKKLLSVTDRFLDVYINFFGYIPLDKNVPIAIKRQKPLIEVFPETHATKALIKIGNKLLA